MQGLYLSFKRYKKILLYIPQLLRKVDIVFVGVFESFEFVPQVINLLEAVFLDFRKRGTFINALSVFENIHKQLLCRKVFNSVLHFYLWLSRCCFFFSVKASNKQPVSDTAGFSMSNTAISSRNIFFVSSARATIKPIL